MATQLNMTRGLALMLCLLTGALIFSYRAQAQTSNVALGKPAFASSGNPSLAVDGNTGSRWESTFADPQWIYVDLQGVYNLSKIVLKWETASGKAYNIQVSNNLSTWTNIYTTTTGAGGTETLNVSAAGRYVRMFGTVRNTQWGYSLWEYEILGTPVSAPVLTSIVVTPANTTITMGSTQQFTAQGKDQFGNNIAATFSWAVSNGGTISASGLFTSTFIGTFAITVSSGSIGAHAYVTVVPPPSANIALYKTCSASSARSNAVAVQYVNDGQVNTRWESEWSDPQSVTIDLLDFYNISRVVLKWEAASAKSYKIQTSNDGGVWNDAFITTTGDGGTDEINLSSNGRYIRMHGTSRNTGYGYSLWEFEVYGTVISPVLTSIIVSPSGVTLPVGGVQQFTAQGKDQFNRNMPATVTWSTNGGGTINGNGQFTATTVGNLFLVTATSGSVSGNAQVTVAGCDAMPSSAITSPANGSSFVGPATLNIAAQANISCTGRSIARIDFYLTPFGGMSTLLGSDTSAPYGITAVNIPTGNYMISIVVIDNTGAITNGPSNTIYILHAGSVLPVPGKIEAEAYHAMSGVAKENTSDAGGGQNVGYISANDWMDYNVRVQSSGGTHTVQFRVASWTSNAQFQLKNGATVLCTVDVPNTGGTQSWTTVTKNIYLEPIGDATFRIASVTGGFNFNWMNFIYGNPARASNDDVIVGVPYSYPNPANDVVYVEGVEEGASVQVIDMAGRVVMRSNITDRSLRVDSIEPGNYVMQIHQTNSLIMKRLTKR